MEITKLIIFDIYGKFAHFRKYYTNAASLSYKIPPRTVISGLIAGLMGKERDSYYEEFNTENTFIGISIKSNIRKIMQTINYTNTKTWNFSGNPQQVNLELLIPEGDSSDVRYRIYFYNDKNIDELANRIQSKQYVYNPYFGVSEFLSEIDLIDIVDKNHIKLIEKNELLNFIKFSTCFKKNYISELKNTDDREYKLFYQYIIERMPVNFLTTEVKAKSGSTRNRSLFLFDDYIYEENGNLIDAKIKPEVQALNITYKLDGDLIAENIIFME